MTFPLPAFSTQIFTILLSSYVSGAEIRKTSFHSDSSQAVSPIP
jgi:hypothetical protein